jgi:hypothetical protein
VRGENFLRFSALTFFVDTIFGISSSVFSLVYGENFSRVDSPLVALLALGFETAVFVDLTRVLVTLSPY